MTDLFSHYGITTLRRFATVSSVLAFDLDGTLAPLVSRPADARIPDSTVTRLTALAKAWPLAVITGRSVEDARKRLGFTPQYLYGNHGAESVNAMLCIDSQRRLNFCREHLRKHTTELRNRKIRLEDKGLSLALHYPQIVGVVKTRAWLDELIAPLTGFIHTSHGHHVTNVMLKNAPDKGDAIREIMNDCGAISALVLGDDINDESAFSKAPAGCVTVRIGPLTTPTHARFGLSSQSKVDRLLSILLAIKR